MQSMWNKYVMVESSVSSAINACISIGFAAAVFHGRTIVMPLGSGGLVRDAVPQTLGVALMGSLVPLLLTRKRRAKGVLPRDVTLRSGALASPFTTAIFIALIMLVIGAGLQALVLPQVFDKGLGFRQLLVYKTCYGAALGAFATATALRLTWHIA